MTVKLRYGSVCSGIEAATVAWHPLGWEPAFFSEIEPAPRAVLAHHYPDVPLHGDFTTIGADEYGAIDLLVGGTPCQSFSVAGLRGGLDDDRGNLALEFLRLAQRKRPKWLVWENVPGVLSSNGGRDFGSILGGLVELGYGFAYRVLDAQYFGVAQRRRRVFVVGYLGDWRRAAAVLFERHSLQGHSAPSRKAGQRVADTITVGANQCSGKPGDITEDVVARCLTARGAGGQNLDPETANLVPEVATTLTASRSSTQCPNDDTTLVAQKITDHGHLIPEIIGTLTRASSAGGTITQQDVAAGQLIVEPKAFGFDSYNLLETGDIAKTLDTGQDFHHVPNVLEVKKQKPLDPYLGGEVTIAIDASYAKGCGGTSAAERPVVASGSAVRRLTPIECERLQGFPDNYTLTPFRGKPMADGPRYKALGNSMAVPVMRWIGERIAKVEEYDR